MNLPIISKSVNLPLLYFCFFIPILVLGQNLSDYQISDSEMTNKITIDKKLQFNGYTNHWHDDYTLWHRYGNLFKMAVPDLYPTIWQSKVDNAEDMGIPGLLMQEGFLFHLLNNQYEIIENPTPNELESRIKQGNTLVIANPDSDIGRQLNKKSEYIFRWTEDRNSHQFNAANLERIWAYFLVNENRYLFVIASSSQKQTERLKLLINNTKNILEKYRLHKGWFGAATLLKSVTCAPGHPMELIGMGMNEGNSWFIFDGYMDFLAKEEIENWVNEVNLPVVANVGFSPIYGCGDYDQLQVQDMATKQAWIDYAHIKGGFAFRPVYDPESDNFNFDGYIAHEGNKKQIDNEDVPFINRTGLLSGNLTSSMVLFVEKEKQLTNETLWEAIMKRKAVAVLEKAKMMGPAEFRNTLQLLYLDKMLLEDYFSDKLDIEAKTEGYNLVVQLKNYASKEITGQLEIVTSPALKVDETVLKNEVILAKNEAQFITIPISPLKEAMGKTNPIAIHFSWYGKKKSTVTMLDLPPAVSLNKLLYSHAPEVNFPVTVHNFSENFSFPVEMTVYRKDDPAKIVLQVCL